MILSLADALSHFDLQPGQTYRESVNGHTVEVRVLDDDEPTPELAEQVMMQMWVDIPFNPVATVQARWGALPLPDPPVIPMDDGESE